MQEEPKIPVMLTAMQMEAIREMCDRTLKSPDGGIAVMGMVASILMEQEQAVDKVRAANQAQFAEFMRSKNPPPAPPMPEPPPPPPPPQMPEAPEAPKPPAPEDFPGKPAPAAAAVAKALKG